LCISGLFAQDKKPNLVQLSGIITNELLQPLQFAHIFVLNNYRGTITDREGKFSFVTQGNDSIMFSTVGYKKKIIIIPDTLLDPFLHLDIRLEQKLPEGDMERARKNIAMLKTQIILDQTPSARANYQKILNEQYRETFRQGTYPSYQIFNVFAWAKFFEALQRGDFSKYKDKSENE
jgi:hypothetical protein